MSRLACFLSVVIINTLIGCTPHEITKYCAEDKEFCPEGLVCKEGVCAPETTLPDAGTVCNEPCTSEQRTCELIFEEIELPEYNLPGPLVPLLAYQIKLNTSDCSNPTLYTMQFELIGLELSPFTPNIQMRINGTIQDWTEYNEGTVYRSEWFKMTYIWDHRGLEVPTEGLTAEFICNNCNQVSMLPKQAIKLEYTGWHVWAPSPTQPKQLSRSHRISHHTIFPATWY